MKASYQNKETMSNTNYGWTFSERTVYGLQAQGGMQFEHSKEALYGFGQEKPEHKYRYSLHLSGHVRL